MEAMSSTTFPTAPDTYALEHGELVTGRIGRGTIDQAVEVRMFDAQLDQPARQ